ncbi:Ig-like domain-containing protein [Endozoicomonas sp.]|uniref:Ig-like domain-containing protein n=1 Tax=Endozoicomonas sp. TaxID=1892382 RepID=UPI003D9B2AD9
MRKLTIPSEGARVGKVSGVVWKLLPDGSRQRIFPEDTGEALSSGITVEVEDGSDIDLVPDTFTVSESLPQREFLPGDQPDYLKRSSTPASEHGQSASMPFVMPLSLARTVPSAGFVTGAKAPGQLLEQERSDLFGDDREQVNDTYALLKITAPITADNIVNLIESGHLIIAGTVTDIEDGQNVQVSLTDQNGKNLQASCPISASQWQCVFNDMGGNSAGLTDGPVLIKASASDLFGNTATDSHSFILDTFAWTRIDDIDSIGQTLPSVLSGHIDGVEQGRAIELTDTNPIEFPYSRLIPNEGPTWQTPIPPIQRIIGFSPNAFVSDLAGNIATDYLPPIGNPAGINIDEHIDLSVKKQSPPIANERTDLAFDLQSLQQYAPQNLEVIDQGQVYPLKWQISDNAQVLNGVYSVNGNEQIAIHFQLPDNGSGLAEFTLESPLRHPDGQGQNSIRFTLPYLKSDPVTLHRSLAGQEVDVTDDVPTAKVHDKVELVEGSIACWHYNGKLFTQNDAGSDGARLTTVDHKPIADFPTEASGNRAGWKMLAGHYGNLFFQADGRWFYKATPDQVHPGGQPLSEQFDFTLTDYDEDDSSASITFDVLDGKPISTADIFFTADQECQSPPSADSEQVTYFKGSDTIVENSLSFDADATLSQFKLALSGRTVTSSGIALDLSSLYPDSQNRNLELKRIDGNTVARFWIDSVATDHQGDVSARISVLQTLNLSVKDAVTNAQGTSDLVLPVVTHAFEIHDDMAEATAYITMKDGKLDAQDDTGSVVEGQSLTGNVMQNDTLCSHVAEVSDLFLSGSFLPSGKDSHFLPKTTIQTLKGELRVDKDGSWNFSSKDSLNQLQLQQLPFQYTLTAIDGHEASATCRIDITDGAPPTGGFTASLTLTEAGLQSPPLYPTKATSNRITISGDGSDPISPASLAFTDSNATDLSGKYFSGHVPVTFTVSGKILTGVTGSTKILNIKLIPEPQTGKDLDFKYEATLYQPLDHPANNGLNLPLTVTAADIDNSSLVNDGSLSLTLQDGADLQFSNQETATLDESVLVNQPVIQGTAHLLLTPGSDKVEINSWGFSADQPGLNNLTSLGHPLTIQTGSNSRTLQLQDSVTHQQVLTLTLDNLPSEQDQSTLQWTAKLHQAMDQNQGSWPLKLAVEAADMDNDKVQGWVYLDISNDQPKAVDHDFSLIEGESTSSTQEGTLFTAEQAGADLGKITAINGTDLSSSSDFQVFPGKLGSLSVKPDGTWYYQALPNLVHPPENILLETFTYTLTDSDGDESTANITFSVEDGALPHFDPKSAPIPPSTGSSSTDPNKLMTLDIDQECQVPPQPDKGDIIVIKGSDSLPIDQSLQFDPDKTLDFFKAAIAARSPQSNGHPIDLTGLNQDADKHRLELKTDEGKTVLLITLDNFSQDANTGNLMAEIHVLQQNAFQVSGAEPAILPVALQATDHDGDTVRATVQLNLIDGIPTATDDYHDVDEGKTVSGNLLDNDNTCMDETTIIAVELGFGSNAAGSDPNKITVYPPGTSLTTQYGTLVVNKDGSFQFDAHDSLKNNPDPVQQIFSYTLQDIEGHQDDASVYLSIYDGAPPEGHDLGKITLTEGEISGQLPYPVTGSLQGVLSGGSDPADANTVRFAGSFSDLDNKLTSLGEPLFFTQEHKSLQGKTSSGVTVLSILTHMPLATANKEVPVTHEVELFRPLDHQGSGLINNLINNLINVDGNDIVLKLPMTFSDFDGSPAQKTGLLEVNIKDGLFPSVTDITRIAIDEKDIPAHDSEPITLGPGSDLIAPSSLRFADNQPGLTGLFSNDQLLKLVREDDQTLKLDIGGNPDTQVLTLKLDDVPAPDAPSTVPWSVQLDNPMDQDKGQWPLEIAAEISDSDGDIRGFTLVADIRDNVSGLDILVNTPELTLIEPLLNAPLPTTDMSSATVHAGTDNIKQVHFLTPATDSQNQAIDDSGLPLLHDGLPIHYKTEANQSIEAWSYKNGTGNQKIFTLSCQDCPSSSNPIPANTFATVHLKIEWFSFLDHKDDHGQKDNLKLPTTVTAIDTDGSQVQDQITLTLSDGALPVPGDTHSPEPVLDINRGQENVLKTTLEFTPGSDRVIPEIGLTDLQSKLQGLSSDGYLLDRIEKASDGTINVYRSDGQLVFTLKGKTLPGNQVELEVRQLDNIDHIPTALFPQFAETKTVFLKVWLNDSDGDKSKEHKIIPFIINDTDPSAEPDHFNNGNPIATEGQVVPLDKNRGLMINDQLNADADKARLTELHYSPYDYQVPDGSSITVDTPLGTLTVFSDSQWSLDTRKCIDHSGGRDRTETFQYTIMDGDCDISASDASITIRDLDASFRKTQNASGIEDQTSPVPVSFEILLGDIDRSEKISQLWVVESSLQGGQLTYQGSPLTAKEGRITLPLEALIPSDEDCYRFFASNKLGYLPPDDGSDFSFAHHKIQLELKADISKNPGSDQSISGQLKINISGVADKPLWNTGKDIDYFTTEEDHSLTLTGAGAQLQDTDGSETLTYEILAIPEHATLKLNNTPLSAGHVLTASEIQAIEVIPDSDWSGKLLLPFKAIATESAPFSVQTDESDHTLTVDVQPVADQPSLTVSPAQAGGNTARVSTQEDHKTEIADYIHAELSDTDGSEQLFILIKPMVSPGEDPGSFWLKQPDGSWLPLTTPGNSQNARLLPDGSAEVPYAELSELAYQPGKDRSSANFSDLQLKINAVSKESPQQGVDPSVTVAISADKFLELSVKGVPDTPLVTGNAIWVVDPLNTLTLTGTEQEDQALPIQFDLKSADIDGSESLNVLLDTAHLTTGFMIRDSQNHQPPIAGISGNNPVYQLSQSDLTNGTYRIVPPLDYAGEQLLTLKTLVTEKDGARSEFPIELTAKFLPVVDTIGIPVSYNGREVDIATDPAGFTGGAALTLDSIKLKDTDGSESLQDINRVELPSGFLLYQKSIAPYSSLDPDQPLASQLGGRDQLINALRQKQLVIVPGTGNDIDTDFPTTSQTTTDFTFYPVIRDQQNNLETTSEITIKATINWTGEVDGPTSSPVNNDENTRIEYPPGYTATGPDIPLTDFQFTSTDTDQSEHVNQDNPVFKVSLLNVGGQPLSNGWHLSNRHLSNSSPDDLTFNGDEWLVSEDSLSGTTLHVSIPGNYELKVESLISDIGDLEARSARFDVVNNESSTDHKPPHDPGDVFTCTDGIKAAEDNPLPLSGCVDPSQALFTNETTEFRINASDLPPHWGLTGDYTRSWGENGETISYLIHPGSLPNIVISPARDFSGQQTIPLQILQRNNLSDQSKVSSQDLIFKVSPVVDDNPEIKTEPDAKGMEWTGKDQAWPLNLTINSADIDGSERVINVELTPPAGIQLEGDDLSFDGTRYILTLQPNESVDAFNQRLTSIQFIPGQGLSGKMPVSVDFRIQDNAPDISESQERDFTQQVQLDILPANNCASLISPAAEGDEDSDILLTGLQATLNDNDGSEALSALIEGVPNGATLSDPSDNLLPANGNGSWQIPASLIDGSGHIASLKLRPPLDFSGELSLQLTTYSHEHSLTTVCTDMSPLPVKVRPVGDDLTLKEMTQSSGHENVAIHLPLDIKTTDTYSDPTDHPEVIAVTVKILNSSDPTIFPPEASAEKPSIETPDGVRAEFVSSGPTIEARLETTSTALPHLIYQPGDGHGKATLQITAHSVDNTDGFTPGDGSEVNFQVKLTITPASDKPECQVEHDTITVSKNVSVPLGIKAAVVNPALQVNNLVKTELYVQLENLPPAALLINSVTGQPVGVPTTSPAGWALTTSELNDLAIKGLPTGQHDLRLTAVSDAGDGAPQQSASQNILVTVTAETANIETSDKDDLVLGGEKARTINTQGGNDTIGAGLAENTVIEGSGNGQIWGGELNKSGDGKPDHFVWQAGDEGAGNALDMVMDFEPGLDKIDLSAMLNIQSVWSTSQLSSQLVVTESDNHNAVIYWTDDSTNSTSSFNISNGDSVQVNGSVKQLIYLDNLPLNTLIPGGDSMTTAQRLSSLVESGALTVSNQFGHEGPDVLHDTVGGLTLDAGGDNDELYAHSSGSTLIGNSGDDQNILGSSTDTSVWKKGHEGTSTKPASDILKNFASVDGNKDVVDISELLPDEASHSLDGYLKLEQKSSDSLLKIATENPDEWTQLIVFEDTLLIADGQTADDALRLMIEQGQLQTNMMI